MNANIAVITIPTSLISNDPGKMPGQYVDYRYDYDTKTTIYLVSSEASYS